MSHQTGIKPNDALKKFLGKCRDTKTRIVKISINNEQLTLAHHKDAKHGWEKDFDKLVVPVIEPEQPCYILYRLDTKNASGYEWLFISWTPDIASIRQKMLYASTKATLKQEFGTSQIKEEFHATVPSEVSLNGYMKYKKAHVGPAPLTSREEELQEIRKHEIRTDFNVDSKQQTLAGVAFPLTESAKQGIKDMLRGSYNYLQLKISIEEETIHLVCAENVAIEKLSSKVPENAARYHLYRFEHTHEGDFIESVIFIYSMPGYNCTIKERMLYSSCKNPLTEAIAHLGMTIEKKLEIDSGSELTEQFLHEEVHPTTNLHKPKFAKPKGPPNRGPKRMTKNQEAD